MVTCSTVIFSIVTFSTVTFSFYNILYCKSNAILKDKHKLSDLTYFSLPLWSDLSAVQLVNSESTGNGNKNQAMKAVMLKEGHGNSTITLQVIGDVPRYTVMCIK